MAWGEGNDVAKSPVREPFLLPPGVPSHPSLDRGHGLVRENRQRCPLPRSPLRQPVERLGHLLFHTLSSKQQRRGHHALGHVHKNLQASAPRCNCRPYPHLQRPLSCVPPGPSQLRLSPGAELHAPLRCCGSPPPSRRQRTSCHRVLVLKRPAPCERAHESRHLGVPPAQLLLPHSPSLQARRQGEPPEASGTLHSSCDPTPQSHAVTRAGEPSTVGTAQWQDR
mmetsp:Transcript_12688/g.31103  ORF Transcript_12688/g.31103 Transcript_12688/m.31103 type:complete len:224 (+) Transcript_12688:807-1478(+)